MTDTQRSSNGQFVPGNKGGPGNPYARQTAALRKAFANCVTPGDIQAMMQTLVARARVGHLPSIRLVLSYAIGSPGKAVDPDTLDRHELEVRKANAATAADLAATAAVPASAACEIAAAAEPEVRAQVADLLHEGFEERLDATPPGELLIPARIAETLEACPAWKRPIEPSPFALAWRRIARAAVLGKRGDGRQPVPPADDKR